MPQRARTFKVNCCLNVHNAHLKLLSPISGYATYLLPIVNLYNGVMHLKIKFKSSKVKGLHCDTTEN